MKSIVILKLISAAKSYDVVCPELICESKVEGKEVEVDMADDLCYKMNTEIGEFWKPIYARECYDQSTSKKSEQASFCPFNLVSGEYAWVDEKIQDEEQGACKF